MARAPRLALKITPGQILTIGLPLMGGLIFQVVIQLTEILYVSQVGEDEFAALTIASLFYMSMMLIAVSILQGAQILIARRAGEGNVKAIGVIVDTTLFIAVSIALLLFLIARFASVWVLDLLIEEDAIYRLSLDYLRYRAWGIPFTFSVLALGGFYAGIGQTMAFVWSASVMALVNIGLNDALVLGKHGFPEMGLQGAALAGLISEITACTILFTHAFLMRYPARFHFFKWRRPKRKTLWEIASLSGPIALQQMTGSLSWFFFFVLIENEIGKQALNATQILRSAYLVVSVTARALGGAGETIVSNVIGQGKPNQVRLATRRTSIIAVVFTCVLMIPLIVFASDLFAWVAPVTSVPVDMKTDAVTHALDALPILCAGLILLSIGAVYFRAVTGTGGAQAALKFEIIASSSYLAFGYVIIVWFNANLALAWTADLLYWILLIILSHFYLSRGHWPSLDRLPRQTPAARRNALKAGSGKPGQA
jgi:putative MATE family efflux protein